jgi:hypothetical protein
MPAITVRLPYFLREVRSVRFRIATTKFSPDARQEESVSESCRSIWIEFTK